MRKLIHARRLALLFGVAVMALILGTKQFDAAVLPQEVSKQQAQVKLDDFGDPLPPGALAHIGTLRFRHGEGIRSISLSEDGTTLATGSSDQFSAVRIWEAKTGRQLQLIEGLGGYVSLSPDGDTLVISGKDDMLRLWDVKSRKETRQIRISGTNLAATSDVLFSPNGDLIAVVAWFGSTDGSGPSDSTIRLISSLTGKEQCQLVSRDHMIGGYPSLCFSSDGRMIAMIGDIDRRVRIWETATGKLRGTMSQNAFACAIAPNGKSMAVRLKDSVELFDLHSKSELWSAPLAPQMDYSWPMPLAFTPDGQHLLASRATLPGHAETDYSVAVWQTDNGRLSHTIPKASAPLILLSPDGKVLYCAGGTGILAVDASQGKRLVLPEEPRPQILSVTFSPDGQVLATGGTPSGIQLYESAKRKRIQLLAEKWADVVAFSKDGKNLASAGTRLCWWDLSSGKLLRVFEGHDSALTTVALGHGGQSLVSGSYDGTIRWWDVKSGKETGQLEAPLPKGKNRPFAIYTIAEIPNSKLIAAHTEYSVFLWDVDTKQLVDRQNTAFWQSGPILRLAASPDGRWLAFEQDKPKLPGPIVLYDIKNKKVDKLFGQGRDARGVSHWGLSFAFSPDSKILATGSADKSVRLWDVASGKELKRFDGHIDRVSYVDFSPDGKMLASSSWDGTVVLWDVAEFTGIKKK